VQLTYALPSPAHMSPLGQQEVDRRAGLLTGWASPGTTVEMTTTHTGPASIESMYEEYLAIPALAESVLDGERRGADATIIGCFGDPGLDGVREVASRPVVGPAAASMALAATLGHRFSVVTVADSIRHPLRRLAFDTGVEAALSSVRAVNLTVLAINGDHDSAYAALAAECKRCLADDDADTLVLGCMSMGFLGAAERLTGELGVPVVNPVRAAVHLAETLHHMGLAPSRRAFPPPPKVTAGTAVADLLLTADPHPTP
jgi:allantoin racemase